ncbi:hypothetical protein PVL29_022511 [Vitis rotundifolia]|uniref:Dentin sialophosphoprotein-like protein n=1 Tax=Vitis rotundifolia TaxID=103349 RepID=A0AA38YW70_VITRO|nr:hypothetical protein PVL29_022511 [Vitis rotundifolia]
MPGNEVGDRVHNFFGQDNLSQGQHHSQAVDGNWPGLNNNLWVGNQRQIGTLPTSNPKNYSVQQPADSERGHGSQSSRVPHGLNFTQSTLRPDIVKNQSQNQQLNLNGYMHGHTGFQARQNEANLLGVDTESDRHSLTSRGLSSFESQRGNGPEHHRKNSVMLETTESPVNFDFLGGQPQMGGQQSGMLQSLARQQSGFNDMQILQQQVMLKQMQELQRQQQIQQQETRQHNSINQIPSFSNQAPGNQSPAMINGAPIHDASNYSWHPEFMSGNTNWIQRGASPVIQGSSNGLMFSPDQGQALRMMGLAPQQGDQSLYGVPVSNTRGTSSQYSHMQVDRAAMQQTPSGSNSFPSNQYTAFPDQPSMQDGNLVSKQGFPVKKLFGQAPGQNLSGGVVLENLQQLNSQQRNAPLQEFHGRQNLTGSSETLQQKTVMQVARAQSSAGLDPTEEKFLYGTDDNIWDVFGKGSNMGTGGHNQLDGTDIGGAFPSMQSGSWSALMQSAVAETSSNDIGLQEEWSGPIFQSIEPPTGNPQPATYSDGGKKQTVWADNLQVASSLSSKPFSLPNDVNMTTNYSSFPGFQQSGLKFSNEDSERLQMNSSHRSIQHSSEEGSKWLDRNPPQKTVGEGNQNYGSATRSSDAGPNLKSISGPWVHQQSISSYSTGGQPCNKPNGWNFIESGAPGGDATMRAHENENLLHHSQSNDLNRAMHGSGTWKADSLPDSTVELDHVKRGTGSSQVNREDSNRNNVAAVPNFSSGKTNQETSQQLPNSQHDYWKNVASPVNSKGNEGLGKHQHHLNKSPQVLESSVNSSTKGAVEMHEMENCDKKENSSDGYRSNLSHRASSGGLRENVWLDASDSRSLPGAKPKLSGQVGRKTSGSRRFQYHPMGNLEVDIEPSYEAKHVSHAQAMSQQVSRGFKSHEQGFSGPSKFSGHVPKDSNEMEKGPSPEFQGDTRGVDEVPSRGIFPGSMPNMAAPSDRSVGSYIQNKTAQSSQNMLELLHKVDQSRDRGTAAQFSSSERNPLSEMPEPETSDGSVGHLQRNQSSASQGFGLQLAPPSQRLPVPNRSLVSQSSSQTVNLLNSHTSPEIGDKSRAWLASTASVQSLPPAREASQGELRNNRSVTQGQTGKEAPQPNIGGSFSTAFTPGFPYSRSPLQNQHMTVASGQVTSDQSVNASFDRFAACSRKVDDSHDRIPTSQSATAPLSDLAANAPYNNITSMSDMSHLSSSNQLHVRGSTQQTPEAVPVSRPSFSSGTSHQDGFSKVPNVWTNVSTQQCLPGVEAHKAPSNVFKSHFKSTSNSETTSSTSQKLDDQDAHKGGSGPSEFGVYSLKDQAFGFVEEQPVKDSPWKQVSSENIDPVQKPMHGSQGKESVGNHLSAASPSNPAATQRDIEAFGRSLKPNNSLNQNFSLLHQMHAMKGTEIDPGNRGLKRFKGLDCSLDSQGTPKAGQQLAYGYNTVARDASVNHTSVPSEDPKILSFSSEQMDNRNRNASSQVLPGSIPSQDMLVFGRNDSQNYSSGNNSVSSRAEHSQISPQMAPSWFDQYGTFKNGQMFPMYDAHKTATMRTVEQPFIVGKSSDSLHTRNSMDQVNGAFDTSQVANVQHSSTPISMASDHLSAPLSLPPNVTDQSLVVARPNKRKSATCELLPWHKEVTQFRRLQKISMAELDWAQATNRLIDRVEDEAEIIEDGLPFLRPKRRLILTTQLMQQLLCPPPAAILSVDASSNCESVVSSVARLTLGDACSFLSVSGSDSSMSLESGNLLAEKHKTSEKIGDQYFTKVMEDFISRARKLEKDLFRLDNGASILDLRVECQDLEKFSVINRFAKFHSRGQADGPETSSSSDATANAQKTCPQRYVTALPMPRNLPDRVQCLSL